MAAFSLPHDVLPDSDERHERTHHRAAAHLDLMLEVAACGKKEGKDGLVLDVIRLLGAMEVRSALLGRRCSKLKDLTTYYVYQDNVYYIDILFHFSCSSFLYMLHPFVPAFR